MKIHKNKIISWEPLTITIVVSKGMTSGSLAKLGKFVRTWLEGREQKGICTCDLSEFECKAAIHTKQLQVHCEWMCRVCVRALANDVAKAFRSIERFEIGVPPDPRKSDNPLQIQFYQVPAKRVRLESGLEIEVGAFQLSNPIRVAQFADFTAKSGYTTVAERMDDEPTYFTNAIVSQLGRNVEAVYLCWRDVSAFCSFTGFRLPTEAEWLAAAVLDFKDRISTDEYWKRMKKRGESELLSQPARGLVLFNGCEFTASEEDDKIVVRSGPQYWLTFNWKRPKIVRRHRHLVASDYREIQTVFRVVKELKQ